MKIKKLSKTQIVAMLRVGEDSGQVVFDGDKYVARSKHAENLIEHLGRLEQAEINSVLLARSLQPTSKVETAPVSIITPEGFEDEETGNEGLEMDGTNEDALQLAIENNIPVSLLPEPVRAEQPGSLPFKPVRPIVAPPPPPPVYMKAPPEWEFGQKIETEHQFRVALNWLQSAPNRGELLMLFRFKVGRTQWMPAKLNLGFNAAGEYQIIERAAADGKNSRRKFFTRDRHPRGQDQQPQPAPPQREYPKYVPLHVERQRQAEKAVSVASAAAPPIESYHPEGV